MFETNVFGVIAVTQAMLPLLREAPAPRIVNMGSSGVESAGIKVNSADPGLHGHWPQQLPRHTQRRAGRP